MKRPLSITSDPIPQLTWRIALPASVGMFFNTLFNFVDTYCAGLLGTDALAALSVSFPLFFLLIAIGSGLSQGATAMISNALGAGDVLAAKRFFAQSLSFAIVAGIMVSILGPITAPDLLHHLGAGGSWLAKSLSYIDVIFYGAVFFIVSMALNAGLAAQGETRVYRNFLIAGFFTNCALNPLLMWGFVSIPAMGVAGLAVSTVLIQIGGCVWLWIKVRKTALACHLSVSDFFTRSKGPAGNRSSVYPGSA